MDDVFYWLKYLTHENENVEGQGIPPPYTNWASVLVPERNGLESDESAQSAGSPPAS